MQLDTLPRFNLADFPTPIHHLKTLTTFCQGPDIYMKRDDLTSLGMGGNKTRKLEFLVGQALADGADTLVTAGGIQSNHCRLTAAAACRAGLACELVLNGTKPDVPNGNLLLDTIFKARVHYCARESRDATLVEVAEALTARGKKPFVIPIGGSNAIGSVGYVNAMVELKAQLSAMDLNPAAIIFASSSGGTQAGLTLGARLTGFSGEILGISIDQTKTGEDSFLPVLAEVARETAARIGSDMRLKETDFSLDCEYLGAGYAKPGDLEFTAIERLAQTEGILLGPVYTARAMGGLLDLIQKKVYTRGQSILFWHTGGTPELFAWADRF